MASLNGQYIEANHVLHNKCSYETCKVFRSKETIDNEAFASIFIIFIYKLCIRTYLNIHFKLLDIRVARHPINLNLSISVAYENFQIFLYDDLYVTKISHLYFKI